MENSLKAILIGAGVVITLIVVSIGFLLMRSGQSTAKNAIGKLSQIDSEMSDSEYTMYDDMEVSGSVVVNLLKKYKNEYIGIKVETKKNATGTWYINQVSGDTLSSVSTDIANTMDETKIEYINPNGKFKGEVQRDANGTVIALIFKQK